MTNVRWLTPREERAWRGYRRMKALLDLQLSRDMGRDSALSETDYDVLSTLTEGEGPPWRANELAARLLWSSSRLAHQVRRMESRGLVYRRGCDDDKRGALIHLTAEGRQTLEAAAPLHVQAVRCHLIDLLTDEEIDGLAQITERVLSHLSGEREAASAPA